MENSVVEIEKRRLFVDLDGTLAEFRQVDTLEKLYEKNYFLDLKPHENVVAAIRNINKYHPEIEVYILSAVLSDSQYALDEKNKWIDKYLPDIAPENRIFPPCGSDKKDYIEGGVSSSDYLLDDYSINLNSWEPPARGIKLMNGINGNHGTWSSDRIGIDKSAEELTSNIVSIIKGDKHYQDKGPLRTTEGWEIGEVNLIGNGYAEIDIKVTENRNGEQNTFVTTGNFCIKDPSSDYEMKLLNVSDDIFKHPILHREWDTIENAIKDKVYGKIVLEEFSKILSRAFDDISSQSSLWGAWCGRIVNAEKPEEYIDIDVEGIERRNQIIINMSFVNGKECVSMDSCDFFIDVTNQDNLDYVKREAIQNLSDYVENEVKKMSLRKNSLELFSSNTDRKLEDHYKLLSDKGVPEFQDVENIIYQNNHRWKGR